MKVQELMEKIKQYDTIMIHRHRSPDFDAIGSQMALKEMLKLNYPMKQIYAVGDNGYQQFSFIGQIDTVTEKKYKDALVIVVDTANYPRIDDDRFKLAKEIIKIDHHQDIAEDRYGTINLIDPHASSTCELLYVIFEEMMKLNPEFKLNKEIAKYLFTGIYSDTGGFVFPNTKSRTFRVLSELIKYDFDYEPWVMKLRVLEEKIVRLVGYGLKNIEIIDGVGILKFDQDFQKEHKASPRDLSIVVNYMGMFENLKTWVVFNQHPKFIRVNLRSRSEFDVSQIASKFNGGGHKNASGAMIHSWSEAETIKKLLIEMVK